MPTANKPCIKHYKRFHSKLNVHTDTHINNVHSHTFPEHINRQLQKKKKNWSTDLLGTILKKKKAII